jgi:phytoene synthase
LTTTEIGNRTLRETVRGHDADRYLATLFAPQPARDALMALYAFNVDVARIPESVSEPMLGEIRLKWWRDALDTLEKGGVTGNPVADALGEAMRTYALPKPVLLGVIDARAFDLFGQPMPDMPALKAYLQKTQGSLFALAAAIVSGTKSDRDLDAMAGSAGFAWGLTWQLRMLPVHLARGRLYLPASQFHDHGADPQALQALFAGEAGEGARAALETLRAEVRKAHEQAREMVDALDSSARTAFLPLALVQAYLAALERQADSPLERVADINPLRRLSVLTWAALRGRFA